MQEKSTHIIFSSSQNGIMAGSGRKQLFEPFSSHHTKSSRFGALVGYKHFLHEDFGFRLYVLFDGKFKTSDEPQDYKSFNYNLNLDALYNFFTDTQRESNIGFFVGGSLGGVQHKRGVVLASGAEFAVNLGLRANVKRHGIEFYSRFGFLQADKYHLYGVDNEIVGTKNGVPGWNGHPTLGTPAKPNVTYTNSRINHLKITQPYSFGIRYVLSF